MPVWLPFKPAPYASEQPEPRRLPPTPLHPKPHVFDDAAANACLPHDWPICSKRSLLFAPPLIRYTFCGINGWSLLGNANQSTSIVPLLQASVPKEMPTRPPTEPLVNCCKPINSPMMTSGPGTVPGNGS